MTDYDGLRPIAIGHMMSHSWDLKCSFFRMIYMYFEIRVPYKKTANKRPIGHIAHLRNSSNQKTQICAWYDYTISLMKEKRHYHLFENWMVLLLKAKTQSSKEACGKFGWNWPSGSGDEAF